MTPDRYDTPSGEGAVLQNKLGLTDQGAIDEEEAAGFLRAELEAIDALASTTAFSIEYLYTLHQHALGHLYDFAGRVRTVNMSKGDFMFVPAHVLSQTITTFDDAFLKPIRADSFESEGALLSHLAAMHAELLYIHPFREGNGRIARLLTKLIYLAKVGEEIHFELITVGGTFERYIQAIQSAARQEYQPMQDLFRELRP